MAASRREFFQKVLAGAVVATAIPDRPAVAVPPVSPARQEPGWTWIRLGGFKRTQESTTLVAVPETLEDFSPETINADLEQAFYVLETFRACACTADYPCTTHRAMFPLAPDGERHESDEDAEEAPDASKELLNG